MGNINVERSRGVKIAWQKERERVTQGRGTRDWTLKQQSEILKHGRAKGFEGHHVKSVKDYPEYASDPNNIQFLQKTKKNNEHLAAHAGNYKNETNKRYNPETKKFIAVKEGRPGTPHSKELSKKIVERPGYSKYSSQAVNKKEKEQSTKHTNGYQQ